MDPKVKKTTLKNGVRIVTRKNTAVQSVSMGVWLNIGARDESKSENGMSHFIEHMIFKGTAGRSAFQIAKEFDAIGGQTNAFTAMEYTCYYAKVMDIHLKTMVDILSDIFLNSEFNESEIKKEQPVILQEIGMAEDIPEDLIHQILAESYWKDNPLGRSILGPPENITGFNTQQIKNFFRRFYHPEHIVISAAGNIDHEQFINMVGSAFETIKSENKIAAPVTPSVKSSITCRHRDLEQVHVCIGLPGISATDPRRFAISLMNAVLGGNMSSRLFQEIREKRGLAYSVYSFLSAYKDTGMFGVYAGVDKSNVNETLNIILENIKTLKKEKIQTSVLDSAKEYIKGGMLLSLESIDSQMSRIAQNEINYGRSIAVEEVLKNFESVTADDIISLAEELLMPERMAIVTLGPFAENELAQDLTEI